jgi:hypothetical protein
MTGEACPPQARSGKMSNPLDPELMSPAERLEEAASLLARGFLRRRLKRADVENKGLDVLPASSHSCLEPSSEEREET